jgi:hypothetical protein
MPSGFSRAAARVGGPLTAVLFACAAGATGPPPPLKLSPEEVAVREKAAGNDAVGLLALAGLANDPESRSLRRKVFRLLSDQKQTATAAELEDLARRLAPVLPETARTPAEVSEVLGPPKRIARQILYRRYLEQWTYDAPLPLCVVFDCPKGHDPRVLSVHPPGAARR